LGGNSLAQARTDPGSPGLVDGVWAAVHPALAPAEKLAAAGSAVEHLEVELHAALPHIGVFVDHGGYFGALVVVGDLAGESGERGRGGERE